MEDRTALAGVRIGLHHTLGRTASGLLALAFSVVGVIYAAYFVGSSATMRDVGLLATALVLAALVVWAAISSVGLARAWLATSQIVDVQAGRLGSRLAGALGKTRPHYVALERVGRARFVVRESPRDAADPQYRSSGARLTLDRGDGGRPLMEAGVSLTLGEAREACASLNRLLDAHP